MRSKNSNPIWYATVISDQIEIDRFSKTMNIVHMATVDWVILPHEGRTIRFNSKSETLLSEVETSKACTLMIKSLRRMVQAPVLI